MYVLALTVLTAVGAFGDGNYLGDDGLGCGGFPGRLGFWRDDETLRRTDEIRCSHRLHGGVFMPCRRDFIVTSFAWLGTHRHCQRHRRSLPEHHRKCESGQGSGHHGDAFAFHGALFGTVPLPTDCFACRIGRSFVTIYGRRNHRGHLSAPGYRY